MHNVNLSSKSSDNPLMPLPGRMDGRGWTKTFEVYAPPLIYPCIRRAGSGTIRTRGPTLAGVARASMGLNPPPFLMNCTTMCNNQIYEEVFKKFPKSEFFFKKR